ADDEAVADELVVAHALDVDDGLDARRRGTGFGEWRKGGQRREGDRQDSFQDAMAHRLPRSWPSPRPVRGAHCEKHASSGSIAKSLTHMQEMSPARVEYSAVGRSCRVG